jgi:F-type H+-transporting ATPase subunit b
MINFNDPQIWVAISFILFFSFCGKFIWSKLSRFLDNKIDIIGAEIRDAEQLHNDAKLLLSSEMKKFQDLDKEIKNILKDGKLQLQELQLKNKENIAIEIKKIKKNSLEKINYLEAQVINDVKNKIAAQAILVTESFLKKELNASVQLDNINLSINEIETSLKNNSSFI